VAAFAQETLTNDAVLRLVKAGMGEEVVVKMVSDQPGQYSLTTNDVIALKQAGVSDRIIAAMVSRSASATPAISPKAAVMLHDGTPVRLRLTRNLSSSDAKSGDTVDFEVLDDVKVDDLLVIARGATALGTITQAQAKKRMARGGKLDLTIDSVRLVNGDKAALRGVKETSGGGHTGAMTGAIVATSLVAWPAAPFFLFMHGKDSNIPKGTEITAYVDGEVRVGGGAASAQTAQSGVAASAVASATKAEPPAPAPRGIIVRFTSTPGNAEVDVDGSYWGTTPTADLTRLQGGTHTISVRKLGYKPWERKLDLAAGDNRTINAELEVDPTKGHIAGLN
jgi:hypothetical protein